jgi:hypothetical protein
MMSIYLNLHKLIFKFFFNRATNLIVASTCKMESTGYETELQFYFFHLENSYCLRYSEIKSAVIQRHVIPF